MGFSFRGLTAASLVSRSDAAASGTGKDVADIPASVAGHTSLKGGHADEKLGGARSISDGSDSDEELNKVDARAEHGVQNIQALTLVWTKRDLIAAYVLMWLMAFMLAFAGGSVGTLTTYVTSSFQSHSLTALTNVIASLIAGLWKLPYAKIMNIWGRPQALALGVALVTIGLIMMAGCNGVQMYCAAMTFYYTGYNSINFSITVFIADTSKLKNRGLFVAYAASPWLITTWVYGLAVNDVVKPGGIGWRWAFGIYSIVVPIVCAPLITIMFLKQAKAQKQGLVEARPNHGTLAQKAVHYAKEFDVVGLLILATGLALFLLSFNLYSLQPEQWRSPMIICFVIFGALLVVAFGLWEKYGAPVSFVPWHLLTNRTVIGTYTMAAALYISWYVWDLYFYSMLVVLFNQPIVYATYMTNIWTMGSCFISLVYGLVLRVNGHLKWYSLFWGVPLSVLGCGLMIMFRQPYGNVGYIIMCQIFIAFGGGVLVISEQTTIMAVSKQQDFPALLACESMVIAIGSAIGSTIASAMWTGIFPARLTANLPAEAMANFTEIYGSIDVQSSYAPGSPTREAINQSYAETQRYKLIAATCIYATMFVSVALWQNVDIRKQKQRTVGLL